MKRYPFYKQLDLPHLCEELLGRWKEENTFQATVRDKSRPRFNLYEGPPSANGKPGIHHVLSRTLKDLFGRYKTMQGYYTPRQGGWDTHGLPVELQAEKELGIKKEDIGEKVSIEEYNAYCRKIVLRFQKEWNQLTEKIGYWTDLDHPYLTCDHAYMEKVWGVLKKLYQKELLYKGYTIQPYSPAAGTGLSTHELNQPGCYRSVKDTTVVAQFRLMQEENTYLLAWTTTPWTLPANTALALNEKMTYVKVRTFNRYTKAPIQVILAQEALSRYFDPQGKEAPMVAPASTQALLPWRTVEACLGKELLQQHYAPLMPYISPKKEAFYTVPAEFVTSDEGTGIVHIAPTFGLQDFQLARQHNLADITVTRGNSQEPIVDKKGRYVAEITDFPLHYVKNEYDPSLEGQPSLDVKIVQKLKKENKAFLVEKYEHSYPHCWRTDKPVLYYPLDAWFIKTTAYKEALVRHNKTIRWQPASTGTGRFQNWLENLLDWNISRSRFWGTPLPIWRTADGTEEKCIGSIEELKAEVDRAIQAGYEQKPIQEEQLSLHRPYVDKIVLISPTGKKMYREKEVVDVWLDSGAMPYAHQPQTALEAYEGSEKPNHYPAHFIAEGVDQTRGWFFTLHTLAVLLFDTVAFKNVLATGLVLDKKGNKMSKRLGNTIDPMALIAEVGPDPLRWYMVSNTSPWENLKFDLGGVEEVKRKFFGTLFNTYQFFALYANIDQYAAPEGYPDPSTCTRADRWILSRLQKLTQEVTEALDDYHPTPAARAIQNFVVEELSNWYVRLNRKRFWVTGEDQDKEVAYHTLHLCLKTVTQLAAPIAPFFMDRLYRDLMQKPEASVHLTDFPTAQTSWQAPELEAQMKSAQQISSLVHALRKKHALRVRLPLNKIVIPIQNKKRKEEIEAVADLILKEVNVKTIQYVDSTDAIVHKRAQPNFQKAGKKYGSKVKILAQALSTLTQEEIQQLEQKGHCILHLEGVPLKIPKEDIQLTTTDLPGWAVASEKNGTVALDLTLTEALQYEGWARELVNKLQQLRKEQNFAVEDKIVLCLHTADPQLKEAITRHQEYIAEEVQALEFLWQSEKEAKTLSLEGKEISVAIARQGASSRE